MDRLDALLKRFQVKASLFHSGWLCGIHPVDRDDQGGYIHVIRRGTLEVRHAKRRVVRIAEPSVLFYPTGLAHTVVPQQEQGAEMVCARVSINAGRINPVSAALPPVMVIPIRGAQPLEGALELLFSEAFGNSCGRGAAIERLFEVVLIHILRIAMEEGKMSSGMLSGLSHPQLAKAIVAVHENPAADWTLDTLAQTAGMSRSNFAGIFRAVVGVTPGDYLADWRMAVAQELLVQGRALKHVATDVGYGSAVAFSRAFKARLGSSPREWGALER